MTHGSIVLGVRGFPHVDAELVRRALLREWAPAEISAARIDSTGEHLIDVDGAGESWFRVTWDEPAGSIGINGLPEQSARAAAALRAEFPESAPRLILVETKLQLFAELPWSITATEILADLRSLDHFDENA